MNEEIPQDIKETLATIEKFDFKKVFRINKWETAALVKCDPKGQPITIESSKKKRLPQLERRVLIPTFDLTVDTPGSTFADHVDESVKQATEAFGENKFDMYAVLKEGGLEVGIAALPKYEGYYKLATDFHHGPEE